MYLESVSGRLVKISLTPEHYFRNSYFVAIKVLPVLISFLCFICVRCGGTGVARQGGGIPPDPRMARQLDWSRVHRRQGE